MLSGNLDICMYSTYYIDASLLWNKIVFEVIGYPSWGQHNTHSTTYAITLITLATIDAEIGMS